MQDFQEFEFVPSLCSVNVDKPQTHGWCGRVEETGSGHGQVFKLENISYLIFSICTFDWFLVIIIDFVQSLYPLPCVLEIVDQAGLQLLHLPASDS